MPAKQKIRSADAAAVRKVADSLLRRKPQVYARDVAAALSRGPDLGMIRRVGYFLGTHYSDWGYVKHISLEGTFYTRRGTGENPV